MFYSTGKSLSGIFMHRPQRGTHHRRIPQTWIICWLAFQVIPIIFEVNCPCMWQPIKLSRPLLPLIGACYSSQWIDHEVTGPSLSAVHFWNQFSYWKCSEWMKKYLFVILRCCNVFATVSSCQRLYGHIRLSCALCSCRLQSLRFTTNIAQSQYACPQWLLLTHIIRDITVYRSSMWNTGCYEKADLYAEVGGLISISVSSLTHHQGLYAWDNQMFPIFYNCQS